MRREAHPPSPYTSPMFSWGSPHNLPEFCSPIPIILPGLCLLLHIHTIFSLYSITPIFHLDSFPSQIRCKSLSPPQRTFSTPLPFREPSLNTPLPIFWDSPGPEPLPLILSSPPPNPTQTLSLYLHPPTLLCDQQPILVAGFVPVLSLSQPLFSASAS